MRWLKRLLEVVVEIKFGSRGLGPEHQERAVVECVQFTRWIFKSSGFGPEHQEGMVMK